MAKLKESIVEGTSSISKMDDALAKLVNTGTKVAEMQSEIAKQSANLSTQMNAVKRATDKAFSGDKSFIYFKKEEALIKDIQKAYSNYQNALNNGGDSESFGRELAELTNAYKALSNLKIDGFDFSKVLRQVDGLESTLVNISHINIGQNMGVASLEEAFKDLKLMADYGLDVEQILESIINKTQNVDLNTELKKKTKEIDYYKGLVESLDREISDLKKNSGLADLEKQFDTIKKSMETEFQNFLLGNNINIFGDLDWNLEYEIDKLTDKIRNGETTASQAIASIKSQFIGLFDNTEVSAQDFFSLPQIQDALVQLEQVSNKVDEIFAQIQNGVKVAEGSSVMFDTSAVSSFSADVQVANTLSEIVQRLINDIGGANTELSDTQKGIVSVLTSLSNLAGQNFDNLQSLQFALQALTRLEGSGISKSGLQELANTIRALDNIRNLQGLIGISQLDFSKFSELKISKASVNNLADFLERLNVLNVSVLKDISNLDFDKLNGLTIKGSGLKALEQITGELTSQLSSTENGNLTQENGSTVELANNLIKLSEAKDSTTVKEADLEQATLKATQALIDENKAVTELSESLKGLGENKTNASSNTSTGSVGSGVADSREKIDEKLVESQRQAEKRQEEFDRKQAAAQEKARQEQYNADVKLEQDREKLFAQAEHNYNARLQRETEQAQKEEQKKADNYNKLLSQKEHNDTAKALAQAENDAKIYLNLLDQIPNKINEFQKLSAAIDLGVATEKQINEFNKLEIELNSLIKEYETFKNTSNYDPQNVTKWQHQMYGGENGKTSSGYTNEVNAIVDDLQSKLIKSLNDTQAKIKGTFNSKDVKNFENRITTISNAIQKVSDNSSFEEIDKQIKTLSSDIDAIEKKNLQVVDWEKQINDLSSAEDKVAEYSNNIELLKTKISQFEQLDVVNPEDIKEAEKLEKEINALIKDLAKPKWNKETSKGKDTGFTDIKAALADAQEKGFKILSVGADKFTASVKDADGQVKTLKYSLDRTTNTVRTTFDAKPAQQFSMSLGNIGSQLLRFGTYYLSVTHLVSYIREGVNSLKEFDSALTKISYTMDLSNSQLENLGSNILDMANNMNTSVSNAMEVAQIYANMKTSSEQIQQMAQPAIILSNLTGQSASEMADSIQAVTNAFEDVTAESSDHIADVLDYVSRNLALDYGKGIEGMSEAVQAAGATADAAGVSFEQLSAIVGSVMETTRQEGSQVGNALRTIFVRLSKASKLDDGIDNETLSNASKALHNIGVEVYNADGSFREFDTIMQELAERWNDLSEAEQANISFQIAATRQTNTLRVILNNWTQTMTLAEEATNSQGNALANQAKYMESYEGKLQALQTAGQTLWVHLLDSEGFKDLIDNLTELVKWLDQFLQRIKETSGLTKSLGVGGGVFAYLGLTNFSSKFKKEFSALSKEGISAFTAIGTAAKTAGVSLGAMITPMLTISGVIAGIGAVIWIFDSLTTTAKEATQEYEKQSLKVEELRSQYESLQKQGVDSNNTELIYLEKRLEYEEKILAAKKEQALYQKVQSGMSAFGDKDNFNNQLNKIEQRRDKQNDLLYGDDELSYIQKLTKNLQEAKKEFSDAVARGNEAEASSIKDTVDTLERSLKTVELETLQDVASATAMKSEIEQFKKEAIEQAKSNGVFDGITDETELNTAIQNWWRENYSEYEDTMKRIESLIFELNNDLNSIEYERGLVGGKTKKANLQQDVERQFSNARDFMKEFSDEELELLLHIGLPSNASVEEARNALESKINPVQARVELDTTASDTISSFATNLHPALSQVKSAYDAIFANNKFTQSAITNELLEGMRSKFAEFGKTFEEDTVKFNLFTTQYNDFLNKVSQGKEVNLKSEFDKMSGAIVKASGVLDNLNSKTAESIKLQLQNEGYTRDSVDAFVDYELALRNIGSTQLNGATISSQLDEIISKVNDTTDAITYLNQVKKEEAQGSLIAKDVNNLIAEAEAAGLDREAIVAYIATKMQAEGLEIQTTGTLIALAEELEALGQNCDKLREYIGLKQMAGAGGVAAYAQAHGMSTQEAAMLQAKGGNLSNAQTSAQSDITKALGNLGKGLTTSAPKPTGSGGGSAKEAADAWVQAFEDAKKQLDELKDEGKISEYQYLQYLRALYQRFYGDLAQYSEQYAEQQKEYLNGMKSLYSQVISYMTSKIDKQISKINEQKQAAISALEAQRDAEIEAIQAEIDALEKKKKAIQDEIDAIKDANDERDRQLKLQKALYELDRMQHDRSKMVYSEEKGMSYQTDMSGARDARTAVDDAIDDIAIAKLQKEIDAIDDQIEKLNDQIDAINKHYDDLIKQTEAYYDSLIAGLEKAKSFWEELAEIEQEAKMTAMIEELGYSVEQLMHDGHAMEDFKQKYLALVKATNDNVPFTDALTKLNGGNQIGDYFDLTAGQFETFEQRIGQSSKNVSNEVNNLNEAISKIAEYKPTLNGEGASKLFDNIFGTPEEISSAGAAVQEAVQETIGNINDTIQNAFNGGYVGTASDNGITKLSTSGLTSSGTNGFVKGYANAIVQSILNDLKSWDGNIEDDGSLLIFVAKIKELISNAIVEQSTAFGDLKVDGESLGIGQAIIDAIVQSLNEGTIDESKLSTFVEHLKTALDTAISNGFTTEDGQQSPILEALFGDLLNPENTTLTTLIDVINQIKQALLEISTISIGGTEGGLVGQFTALADAITQVSTALGIGGDSAQQAGQTMVSGTAMLTNGQSQGQGGAGGSLISALQDLGTTAQSSVGTDAAEAFNTLGTEVDNVLTAIGGGEGGENSETGSKSGSGEGKKRGHSSKTQSGEKSGEGSSGGGSDTLIGAIEETGIIAEEEIGGVATEAMITFDDEIKRAVDDTNELYNAIQALDSLDVHPHVTIHVSVVMDGGGGGGGMAFTGTVQTGGKIPTFSFGGPAHIKGLIPKKGPLYAHAKGLNNTRSKISGLAHAGGMHPSVAALASHAIAQGLQYIGGNNFMDQHGNTIDMLANVLAGGGGGANFAEMAIDEIFQHLPISREGEDREYKPVFSPASFLTGTAFMRGGNWGANEAHDALVGELGPEIMVNPHTGMWELLGEHGPEFRHVPKNAIIFNHLQTRQLLSKGNTIGRGKAMADGTINTLPDGMSFLSGNNTLMQAMSKFNSTMNLLSPTLKSLQTNVASIDKQLSSPNGSVNKAQAINLNIGDIIVNEPVGDVSTLSQNIVNKLPNVLLQQLYKR